MDFSKKTIEKLSWSALEYEKKERSSDWFWALGIIVVTGSITSVIFENYFFAALLVLSGFLLGFFAKQEPKQITYELNNEGLRTGDHLYPYENIKSFWIQLDVSGETGLKPILFIHSERIFMPILSIPIDETIAAKIYSILVEKNIAEVETKEHVSEKIMEMLGF